MFKQVGAVFTLLPKVIAVVTLIEPLFDEKTPGARKKEAALDALRAAGVPEALVGVAEDLVDLVVSVFNAVGIFRKDGVTPVAEAELSADAVMAKRQAASEALNKLDL